VSWERFIRWTCDHCGEQVERVGYGLPKGWVFYKDRNGHDLSPLKHLCDGAHFVVAVPPDFARPCSTEAGASCRGR
jgi:hypothetical protein